MSELREKNERNERRAWRAFVTFCVAGMVFAIAFGIWYPATHESKSERISKLEQQVADLQRQQEKP